MRKWHLFCLAIVPLTATAADPGLLLAYGQLRNASLDATRIAVTENLVLKKDGARFEFNHGALYALEPVLGQVAGAVFVGEGVFSLQPPSELEQKHLARVANGQPRVEEPFREAVLLFTDSTFVDLSSDAKFKQGTVDSKAASVLNDFRKDFRDTLHTNIEARLLAGLLSAQQSLFLADIRGQKHGKLLFSVDPMEGESVSLVHYNPPNVLETWTAFNPPGSPASDERALVHTSRIELDTEVDKRGRLEGAALSEFSALRDGPRLVLVQLAPTLRVSKVAWGDGTELKYIQEVADKDADFWVLLPKALVQGEKYSWKITYAGEGVIRKAGQGNFFVGERDRWYPRLDVPGEAFNDRSTYHMKFHNPKDLTLVATGKPLGKVVDGKTSVSEWETEVPYTVVGFNYGNYKAKTSKTNDPEITVYANSELGDELKELQTLLDQNPELERAAGITAGGFNTTGLMNQTLAEAGNALRLFSFYFGSLPFKNISVTQQPAANFGQSWPTLIFMPYTAFLDGTTRHQLRLDEGRSRQFFDEVGAHEISHQWWGHLVSWKDYHDQWLSEGFAQFSAGLYLHRTAGEKKFQTFLDADREFILNPLAGSTERANDAGPIWLGYRLNTEKSAGASRLIYAKGGLVLHMLRMLLYDYTRGDDSRFIAMMKEFVQTNAGKGASTAGFKAVCDKYFGGDMGWFFEQWVYGTDIPKITIEYNIKDQAEGPVLSIDVTQQNVPDGFRSVMPIMLRKKSAILPLRLVISKPASHNEVKLKEKPDTVEFNPLYGLLCDLNVKKR
jgi:Peptidase family M1 domain